MAAMTTSPPSSSGRRAQVSSAAWQLIHDDAFDRLHDDAELVRLVDERSKASSAPHAELIRLMLGMSLPEREARVMFRQVLEHRQAMVRALGRPVHVRVAALDLLTTRPPSRRTPRESRPIMVAPDLFERALEEAGSDGVTGLPRGQQFTSLLQHELLQRRRRITVVYVDLDGFKKVNDEHGHARGDEILRTLGEAARAVLRRGDVVARLGGDEFGLMLVDASSEEASTIVERLRRHFEERTAAFATSFSAGIAVAAPGLSAEELVSHADRAMYEEKRRRHASIDPPRRTAP